jgi:hypothetical protein
LPEVRVLLSALSAALAQASATDPALTLVVDALRALGVVDAAGGSVPDALDHRAAGVGAFYSVTAEGRMIPHNEYTNWRTTWDLAGSGGWGQPLDSGLLLYDWAAGVGAFYRVNAEGVITLLLQYDGSVIGADFVVIDERNWLGLWPIIFRLVIGPLQGLFDDWAGESFGGIDADEQGWYAAPGGPCVCLGRERVVDPDQWAASSESDYGEQLVAGGERDRREADHGEIGDLQ